MVRIFRDSNVDISVVTRLEDILVDCAIEDKEGSNFCKIIDIYDR